MSNVQRLAQLAAEIEQLAAEESRLDALWGEAIASADIAERAGDTSGMLAAVAAAEQIGPQLLAVLNRIEEIEAAADDAFTAAQEEFENSISPLRDKIMEIYGNAASPDEDWNDYLDHYREVVADLQAAGSEGRAAYRRSPLGFFRAGT